MAAVPVQGSRLQYQNRPPNYTPMQDYWVPEWDHWHQHLRRNFGHPSEQKSQMPLPSRTPAATHMQELQLPLLCGPLYTNMGHPWSPPSWDSVTEIVPYAW
ncbi:Hypothetical predicted protein [Marmota monax]|uniref:Uncharacterized protein n=1 Tax=Marmota monax TaxID=9995 RepID=A0A5E4BVV1_MARMO|nr:Hypothetical predicted protein [Marmota monax]